MTLASFCVLAMLVVTTPCAMALVEQAAAHDCPHCPPQPCHDAGDNSDCDEPSPADKPRSDTGTDLSTLLASTSARVLPLVGRTRPPATGPPPAPDGPRRHLLLVTFNE